MSAHEILANLLAHLARIEARIAAESRSSDSQRYYRLSLLAREHARTKRHIQALGGDAGQDAVRQEAQQ